MNYDFKKMTEKGIINWFIKYGENYTRNKRPCIGCEDDEFYLINTIRVLLNCTSGRDFLQQIHDGVIDDVPAIKRSSYFDALKSSRRLSYVKDVSYAILKLMERILKEDQGIDYLDGISELKERYVCAADGHSIEHATHDKKIKGKYASMTVMYGQNLRTGLINPIDMVMDPKSSKPHEVTFIKKTLPGYGLDRKLFKPLIVYDRASIDKDFWTLGKHSWSIVTRLKSNMKPTFKEAVYYDHTDPINKDITGYYIIGFNNSGTMYQIDYKDPETMLEYSFLTNDETLRPGVVAYLYKIRWRIEKTFDVFKNKLFEKKAWGASRESKEMQANFISFMYNFTVFIENITKENTIEKLKVELKREKDLEVRIEASRNTKKQAYVSYYEFNLKHMFQMTHQFIRCLRSWFLNKRKYEKQQGILIQRITSYI